MSRSKKRARPGKRLPKERKGANLSLQSLTSTNYERTRTPPALNPSLADYSSGKSNFGSYPGYSSKAQSGFTLAEEALQTSLQDHSSWNDHTRLRGKPILFISAGQTRPLECEAVSGPSETVSVDNGSQEESVNTRDKEIAALSHSRLAQTSNDDTFCQETKATTPERAPSADSNSSDEVILFRGRNARTGKHSIASTSKRRDVSLPVPDRGITPVDGLTSSISIPFAANIAAFPEGRTEKRRRSRRSGVDEDILADYIENMRDYGEFDFIQQQSHQNSRNLGASDDAISFGSLSSGQISEHLSDSEEEKTGHAESAEKLSHVLREHENKLGGSSIAVDEKKLVEMISAQTLDSFATPDVDGHSSEAEDEERNHLFAGLATYEEIDFGSVDWRPSSRRRSKKGQIAQAVSTGFSNVDSDLEMQMQMAWKNDRTRKKERKIQREELRALGMLRKDAKPDTMTAKYPLGMTIEEVAKEVEAFIRGEDEVVSFPPMDIHARRIIHELANKFNIKSKSIGKSDQRRPTLIRTKRTLPFADAKFSQAIGSIRRRFLPRLDNKGKRNGKARENRGASMAAACYHEGEIVGAAAPELGAENRGRAMLEKMGWSRGTALGTGGNKGILQPVTHTMKRSKAGLG